MGKAKQNKKKAQIKRRQMIEEVFKKNKKAKEIAQKFDDKIAQRQGTKNLKREKLRELKTRKREAKKEGNFTRHKVMELNKAFDEIRTNRKPGQSVL